MNEYKDAVNILTATHKRLINERLDVEERIRYYSGQGMQDLVDALIVLEKGYIEATKSIEEAIEHLTNGW